MTVSGSTSPEFIVIPTFLAGLVTTFSGIGLAVLCEKMSTKLKRRKK